MSRPTPRSSHRTSHSLARTVAVRGLTAGAVLATLVGTQAAVATGGAAGAPALPTRASGPAAEALRALADHPNAAREAAGVPDQQFTVTDTMVDGDGTTHVRMERTVGGLRVVGGDLVVHQSPTDAWEGVSQTLRAPLTLDLSPALAAGSATDRALAPSAETRAISALRAAGRPELVVDATSGRSRLAWEVISAGRQDDGTPSRLLTYVDADSGQVLRREETIQTVEGDGDSLYSGDVPLTLTQSGSTYQLKDPSRGGTYTTDLGGQTDGGLCQVFGTCPTGTLVSGPDTSFGDGTTANRESAAVDAQYGTDVTWDYYQQVHDRAGIFGDGSGSYNRVHYGSDYVNAFWDGEKMTYGDGDGVDFGPLVSLDVAGHEMSHGVTENTAGLTYSGESGGLNEATSDIFGTMVEFYAANAEDPGDYYIGEEFDLAAGEGFRRMDDPAKDGNSQSCYTSNTKNLDVHYSSGVGNHFFYLLAEGSGAKTIGGKSHSSPTCNGSSITGIGRDAADKIWFRALTVYMTSGTTYAGARTATLDAARDLYGAGSTEASTVAAAWSAVAVG